MHFAQDEDNSARAKIRKAREPMRTQPILSKKRARSTRAGYPRRAIFAEGDEEEEFFQENRNEPGDAHGAEVHFTGDMSSVPTSELPLKVIPLDEEAHPALYAKNRPRFVKAPQIPHSQGSHNTARLGWVYKRPRSSPGRAQPAPFCNLCYARDHISPDCPATLHQISQVVANYESLSE